MAEYYDGTKILTLKDINGNEPQFKLVVGNRTAGKSFYFKRMLVRRFLKTGKKFCVLVRFKNEMMAVAESFFKDVQQITYPDKVMTAKPYGKDLFMELFIDDVPCGYCVPINSADTIKRYSSNFVDVEAIMFDEFQSEINKYCPREIEKFQSIIVSICRGQSQQFRPVPVYMISNAVSMFNPYYVFFGLTKKITGNTKFIRGKNYVFEHCYVESAAKAIASAFAFGETAYSDYATKNSYLLDTSNFIERVKGPKSFQFYFRVNGTAFGVWQVNDGELLYVSTSFDPKYPTSFAIKTTDHDIGSTFLRGKASGLMRYLREYFDSGRCRFEDMACREAFIDFVGYMAYK